MYRMAEANLKTKIKKVTCLEYTEIQLPNKMKSPVYSINSKLMTET